MMNGKVYTYRTGKIGGIIEISPDQEEARKINFPYTLSPQINETLGVKAAGNGELWVMGFGLGKSSINRFNLSTRKMIQRQISIKPYVGSSGALLRSRAMIFIMPTVPLYTGCLLMTVRS